MMEDSAIRNDCNVLVVSLAESGPGRRVQAAISYRWLDRDGGVVDTRRDVWITIPTGSKDPEEWVKQALSEVLLGLK